MVLVDPVNDLRSVMATMSITYLLISVELLLTLVTFTDSINAFVPSLLIKARIGTDIHSQCSQTTIG